MKNSKQNRAWITGLAALLIAGCQGSRNDSGEAPTEVSTLRGARSDVESSAPRFRYDRHLRICVDQNGRAGFNPGHVGECGELINANLAGRDLRNVRFTGSLLIGANFEGANLAGADFRGANLMEAKFSKDGAHNGVIYDDDTRFSDLPRGFEKFTFEMADQKFAGLVHDGAWSDEEIKEIERLLHLGVSPDLNDGRALRSAVLQSRTDVADLLLRYGANINIGDGAVFEWPASKRVVPMLRYLLDRGANPNQGRMPPLVEVAALSYSGKRCEECVRILLEKGADPNLLGTRLREETSALIRALESRWGEAVELLLASGADVNLKVKVNQANEYERKRYDGHPFRTALTVAPDLEMVKRLVERGADVRYRYLAVESNWQIMEYLLSKGADPNQRSGTGNGRTPLMFVQGSDRWHASMTKLLLGAGAKVDLTDSEGRTALGYAAVGGALYSIPLLIQAGADPKQAFDSRGGGIFAHTVEFIRGHCANGGCSGVWQNVLDALLDAGVDPDRPSASGDPAVVAMTRGTSPYHSPMWWTSARWFFGRMKEAGADLNAANAQTGETALILLLRSRYRHQPSDVAALLEAGADPNRADRPGQPPLLHLIQSLPDVADTPIEVVASLLAAGADPNATDGEGFTLLYRAAELHIPALLQALLDAGADPLRAQPNQRSIVSAIARGWGPRHCKGLNFDLIKPVLERLIHAGVDLNSIDAAGMGALHWLASGYHEGNCQDSHDPWESLAHFLLEAGADPNLADRKGRTFLHLLFAPEQDSYDNRKANFPVLVRLALSKGLNPNLTDLSGMTLLDAASKGRQARVFRMLVDAGAVDRPQAPSPDFPSAETPLNACPPGALARGWTQSQGGCRSPQGMVWSTFSLRDVCGRMSDGSVRCVTENATGPVDRDSAEEYCRARDQGRRTDWRVPTFADYVHAFATGYFDETKGTMVLAPRRVIKASTGAFEWRGDEEGPYVACVARAE